jgi:hypothetical protein
MYYIPALHRAGLTSEDRAIFDRLPIATEVRLRASDQYGALTMTQFTREASAGRKSQAGRRRRMAFVGVS